MVAETDVKLALGIGPAPIHPSHYEFIDDSWKKIDLYVEEPGVINMDARNMSFAPESVEAIYASHLLEHFSHTETVDVLKHWQNLLIPGGKLIINVPDFEWACQAFMELQRGKILSPYYNTSRKFLDIFFGSQSHDGEYHKTGFTTESLKHYLLEAGFKEATIKKEYEAHDMGCLIATAW